MNPVFSAFIRLHVWLLRKTGGRRFNMGGRVLLLTSTGAKSGRARTVPLMYVRDGERVLLAASLAGSDKNPAWFFNVRKHPDVEIELDGKRRPMRARIAAEGEEQKALYQRFRDFDKRFIAYQERTTRTIPVVVLSPRENGPA